jgi:hypothetical protein
MYMQRSRRKSISHFGVILLQALILTASIFLPAAETPNKPLPPGIKSVEITDVHNVFLLGTNVYSGSAPESDAAFASLAKLGVKTILSVDGSSPKVDLAHKYGMRYVHLPHGYDGISTDVQAQLVKATQSAEGPLFVHCHHGLHRGPAAVAIICMANQDWTPALGEAWLKAAGTGSNYVGLFQTVRDFQPPTAAQLRALPSRFPETVKMSGLVDAMVAIDERWDHLKAVRKAGYRAPKENPDLQPAHEAVMLWEYYREAQRLPEATGKSDDFITRLKSAEAGAREAEQLLRQFTAEPKAELRLQLDKSFDAMGQQCSSCHKQYRDPAGIKARK